MNCAGTNEDKVCPRRAEGGWDAEIAIQWAASDCMRLKSKNSGPEHQDSHRPTSPWEQFQKEYLAEIDERLTTPQRSPDLEF